MRLLTFGGYSLEKHKLNLFDASHGFSLGAVRRHGANDRLAGPSAGRLLVLTGEPARR